MCVHISECLYTSICSRLYTHINYVSHSHSRTQIYIYIYIYVYNYTYKYTQLILLVHTCMYHTRYKHLDR